MRITLHDHRSMFATVSCVHTAEKWNTAVRRWRKRSGMPVQRNSRRRRITTLKVKIAPVPAANNRWDLYVQGGVVRIEFCVVPMSVIERCVSMSWTHDESHTCNTQWKNFWLFIVLLSFFVMIFTWFAESMVVFSQMLFIILFRLD